MQVTFKCFADIRHFFLGSGFLSYCNQSTGGAGDSFTVFPGLMPSIFIWFIVKRQIYLLYLVTPQRQCSFVKAKHLDLLEHNSFPCVWCGNTGSVVSWGKVKYVLYTFFFFKLIFGFLFSKCFFLFWSPVFHYLALPVRCNSLGLNSSRSQASPAETDDRNCPDN